MTQLANYLTVTLEDAMADKQPLASARIFSTQDHSGGTYTRNADFWGSPFVEALTGISPWNSTGSFQRGGILISPRHMLFATHYPPDNGATVRFVKSDNTVITRTISGLNTLSQTGPDYPDFTIALLDSDVPSGIAFAKVLPDNFKDYLPDDIAAARIPCAATDQEEKLLVQDVATIPLNATVTEYCAMQVPVSLLRLAFYENKVGGDSGNPAFWIIEGQLVLLTLWAYGQNGGAGTSVTDFKTEINAAMTSLGGGYSLTEVNLSSFNKL